LDMGFPPWRWAISLFGLSYGDAVWGTGLCPPGCVAIAALPKRTLSVNVCLD
jgi:hypothetical protein